MKRIAGALAMALLVWFVACSGGEETEKRRIYDTQRSALEKAKEVETVLLKADEERREEIEEIEDN